MREHSKEQDEHKYLQIGTFQACEDEASEAVANAEDEANAFLKTLDEDRIRTVLAVTLHEPESRYVRESWRHIITVVYREDPPR